MTKKRLCWIIWPPKQQEVSHLKVFCLTLFFILIPVSAAFSADTDATLPPPPGLGGYSISEVLPDQLDLHSVLPDSPPPGLESFSIEALECEPAPGEKYSDAAKRFGAAIAAFKARRFRSAAEYAAGVIAIFPGKTWEGRAAFLAARAMGEQKDYDACSSLFEVAREKLPILGDYALYLLAGYYYEGGRRQDAADTYRKLIVTYPKSIIVKNALLNRAEALAELRQYQEAMKMLKPLLGNGPIGRKARLLYIISCIDTAQLETASSQYRVMRLKFPWAGETERAESAVKQAGITPPEMTAGELIRIGDLMSVRGLNSPAVEVYKEALRKSDGTGEVRAQGLLRLGLVYYKMRDNQQAESSFLEALSLSPPKEVEAEIYLALARVYLRTGDTDKFRDAALWCDSVYPGECLGTNALYMLGATFSLRGEYDVAAEIFKWILDECPNTPRADEVMWQEGWAFYMNGDFMMADQVLGDLADRFPESMLVPQALYWEAKALEASGQADKAQEARDELRHSYCWSFYGLLADTPDATTITPRLDVVPAPAAIDVPVKDTYRDKRLARAYELGLQDMRTSAARELKQAERYYYRDLGKLKEIIGLYVFIGEMRRPFDLAVELYRTSLETGSSNLSEQALRLLFPLGYWQAVLKGSSRAGVDPLLVSGVIRQESRFNEGAVSPAGAIGLMQLMPGTAKMVCKKLSIKFKRSRQLLDCKFNVPVGAYYLQSLIRKNNGRLVYALAEYNAGPTNLKRWIKKMPDAPDDVFIEGIDFRETRGYVKKVLRNYLAYRRIYGGKQLAGTPPATASR